jgi:hypothetical protein
MASGGNRPQFEMLAVRSTLMLLMAAGTLAAQNSSATNSVPFVGCKSDGQVGPIEAPAGDAVSVSVSPQVARELAFYKGAIGVGTLAPRGWYCFGNYGSGGATLWVSERPFRTEEIFGPKRSEPDGPAILVAALDGETSGRFAVAEVISRVFPAYASFAVNVAKEFDLPPFPTGAWPTDILKRKSATVVEYQTPANKDGLGTYLGLKKSASSIEGVAILVGATPDLLLLSMRLPADRSELASVITTQFELAAARIG